MFTYTIVHLKFCTPQIVSCVRVYALYLAMHLLQRKKYFIVEGKLSSNFIRLFLARDRRSWLMLFITNTVASNFFFTPVVKGSWSSYNTGKCTLMNVCKTFLSHSESFVVNSQSLILTCSLGCLSFYNCPNKHVRHVFYLQFTINVFQVYFLISEYEQKQPPEVFCMVQHFQFHKFYRNTPVLESLFNNVAGFQACNLIKKGLKHRCFLVFFLIFYNDL